MKSILGLVCVILFLVSCAGPSAAPIEIESDFLRNYINIQEALAADDFAKSKQAMVTLFEYGDAEVRTVLAEVSAAGNIAVLRRLFKPLSELAMKDTLPRQLVTGHCPMADENRGADWIQRAGEVANPYFGTSMLRCGVIKSPSTD